MRDAADSSDSSPVLAALHEGAASAAAPPVPLLARTTRRASFWCTIAWNLLGPNRSRSIFVLGHPRTGTNWFSRIMSHYFAMPRHVPREHRLPLLQPAVLHLHRFTVVPRRTIYLVRDPRDVAVSYYHKIANTAWPSLRAWITRELGLPYEHDNLQRVLPEWIRLMYEHDVGGALPFDQHVRRARALGLYTVHYEALLADGEAAVAGAVEHLTGAPADPERVRRSLEATSFERTTGRRRGESDRPSASARKGVAGDWRNHFGREAARAFLHRDRESLLALGYETDDGWAAELPERRDATG